ncbi:helix-turn-helix domain-containing protein [Nocardia cyriacigeorgica]|uniref:Helix-turn-helix domain-containing protein n=1 Tax=Nocardia cyriacigeorgica TaxID=135487 RepID=A0A5R8NAF4_9NOCA|nr:helix-turn-helix domain-containing protein [Nocardia cyriacigeorgica]TLF72699.1 helix-turn-helix domain-containing protein [Nocardia cyriacigeorgica]
MTAEDPAVAPKAVIAASLRRERTRAGLSLTEVAASAGIAKSTLSQLESGTGNPSLETLWALCVALDMPFSRLLEPPRPSVRLIRAGQGPVVAAERSEFRATLLAAGSADARHDIYRITAEPGEPRRSEPHTRESVEHILLAAGRALVGPSDSPEELLPGDYISYPGDRAHLFEALEPGTWATLVVEHR